MSVLNKTDRDAKLARMEDIRTRMYGPRDTPLATEDLRALNRDYERLKAEYYRGLPAIAVARCPICAEIAVLGADVFGIDGPWWDILGAGAPGDGACAHCLVTLGALDLGQNVVGRAALRSTIEIQPGPAAPFVVPRLMALPGMVCVLYGTARMVAGSTAYLMSYFADPPAPAAAGHQPWLRTQYWYADGEGRSTWNNRTDAWDFDLAPWLDGVLAKLVWIAADDPAMALRRDGAGECPYLDLPGPRHPVSIRQGRIYDLPLPGGPPVDAEDLRD